MQIRYVIIKVDDQDKALAFYVNVLGFVKQQDRVGRVRSLTVASSKRRNSVEFVLESTAYAPARAFTAWPS